jgi:hypothetical protein
MVNESHAKWRNAQGRYELEIGMTKGNRSGSLIVHALPAQDAVTTDRVGGAVVGGVAWRPRYRLG